jgi:hypothetical protein
MSDGPAIVRNRLSFHASDGVKATLLLVLAGLIYYSDWVQPVAQVYGQELAANTHRDYSGYIVFGVALSATVVIGLLLNFPLSPRAPRFAKAATKWGRGNNDEPLSLA